MIENLSLRLRVTIINTIVLIMCTLILTIGTSFSALRTIDSISNTPYQTMLIPTENIASSNLDVSKNVQSASTMTPATIKEEKQKLTTTSVVYMIIVIFIGTICTYLTTKKSLSSVKKLSNEIKNISEHNLSNKLEEQGADDEIKDLTKSFNHMLSRIEDAFESQKRFSSNVAHELRTPLAIVKMKIDVFKKRKEPTIEDYDKLLQVVEKNNNRLSKVVDELLSICNKDSVELKDKIQIHNIIGNIVKELNVVALEKNISINIHEENDKSLNVEFYGNEQLLYRAYYNLIENAVKYNIENGNVDIYLNYNEEYIKVLVKDTGIGIDKEDYENIFKPFYRVDKSRSRKIGGSGLGLSIVKTIIEQHGGNINVESYENGTIFLTKILYKQ